uniref:Uncharacterized protein n=1 Tax=Arion vulgaris TaxID=1028688 RepID=A0A0B7BU50_9EUPU
MPVRYIGRQPFQKAKGLYEICRNLRDCGVGRVVHQKNLSERWPSQKSYFRLTEVIPGVQNAKYDSGCAWGVEVFRGKERGVSKILTGHKRDWILVSKEEEQEFCVITDKFDVNNIPIPTHMTCPPLLEIVLKKEMQAKGKTVPEKVIIPFVSDRLVKELDSEWA